MRGLGQSFKQVIRSMQGSVAVGLGLSQILMPGALASEKVAAIPPAGIYLYGESDIINQLGQQYVIFAQSGQQIVGAVYSPQSEYSCFIGQRTQSELTVNVFESATQVQPQSSFQVRLPTLKAIAKIGPSERQLLATCQREALMLKQHKLAQPHKTIERSKISTASLSQN